jgi:hypothetical protein
LTLRRRALQLGLAAVGLIVIAAAVLADRQWFDRHFLPSFLLPRPWYVLIYTAVRLTIGVLGAVLAFGARTLAARITRRGVETGLLAVLAALLAIGVSEFVLGRIRFGLTGWVPQEEEPLRRADPYLGWILVPSRTGRMTTGGRPVEFAVDASGYRVRRLDEPIDPERPTLVFGGESIMFGEGLTWEESVPAQVSALTGIQSANLAVHGFSTDQVYLRLQRELPRFRRPVAVVSLFMPALFGRNLNDDRPRLAAGLIWQPPRAQSRVHALAGFLVPYRRDDTVERGVVNTREVLRAMVDLAVARGATPLIVVPQLWKEEPIEQDLRRRLLDEAGLPYVLVPIDETWHLTWDRHPDARAARAIAGAIAARVPHGAARQ